MMKAMIVTEKALRRLSACESQVVLFAHYYPNGCKITRTNIIKASQLPLNIKWFARTVLTQRAFHEFRAERNRITHKFVCLPSITLKMHQRECGTALWNVIKKYGLRRSACRILNDYA